MKKFKVRFICEAERHGVLIPIDVEEEVEGEDQAKAIYAYTQRLLKHYDKLHRGKITAKELV